MISFEIYVVVMYEEFMKGHFAPLRLDRLESDAPAKTSSSYLRLLVCSLSKRRRLHQNW